MIALVPQGLMPLIFLAAGVEARAWFAALYLPSPWPYAAAVAFVIVGAVVTSWAVRLQQGGQRRPPAVSAPTATRHDRTRRTRGHRTKHP